MSVEIGASFGFVTVLEQGGRTQSGEIIWMCQCSCGSKPIKVRAWRLRNGKPTNCGCVRRHGLAARNSRHGMYGTKEYRCWRHMHDRCSNKKCDQYHNYGGRGIVVVPAWDEFVQFHADMGTCPLGFTIERIDNNREYGPLNCRWATPEDQARNKRTNHWVILNGERLIFTDACLKLGIGITTADAIRRDQSLSHQGAVNYYVQRLILGADAKPRDSGGKFSGRSGWSRVAVAVTP